MKKIIILLMLIIPLQIKAYETSATSAIIKESYNRTIIALTDGAYILQTNNECKLYGESYKIKNGIIDKICDNDECVILNDSL